MRRFYTALPATLTAGDAEEMLTVQAPDNSKRGRLNRDRKKPHGPSLPHHRAYGSRTRRFDELNYYLAAMFGSPKLLKYRAGNASASAGVLDKRHGPCADLLVFHASRTLTPRRRSSR